MNNPKWSVQPGYWSERSTGIHAEVLSKLYCKSQCDRDSEATLRYVQLVLLAECGWLENKIGEKIFHFPPTLI